MEINFFAISIILIFILICYVMAFHRDAIFNKKSSKNGKKINKKSKKKKEKENEDDDENEKIYQDAEEIFNLVHVPMSSKNMKYNEFKELVQDLADNSLYIELKQLYNSNNPNNITINDYVEILKKERDL